MERRLLLHQKLQASKQKKITIKEGDCLVTLNLRTDIIDPNIEIADKVLFMLEAFAEKIPSKDEPSRSSSSQEQTTVAPVNQSETSPTAKLVSNIKNKDKLLVSPSKRVRFDFEKKTEDDSNYNRSLI